MRNSPLFAELQRSMLRRTPARSINVGRRNRLPVWLVPAVLLVGLTMAVSPARAQEATAVADPLAGTTVETLGSISPMMAEGRSLVLLRITMAPGAEIAAHSHPGAVVLAVDSGMFGTDIVHGGGTIIRASGEEEPADNGGSFVLAPGDALAYDQDTGHTMVNAGDTPLVLLASVLFASDEPGFLFEES